MGRPRWMNDEEWAEYKMTEEYRQEVTYVPDYDPYDYYDDYGQDYADFIAEQSELDWREAQDYMYEGEEEYDDVYYSSIDDDYEDFHADG